MTDVASAADVKKVEATVAAAIEKIDDKLTAAEKQAAGHHEDERWKTNQAQIESLKAELKEARQLLDSLPKRNEVATKSELAEIRKALSELVESLEDPEEEDPLPPETPKVTVVEVPKPTEPPPEEVKKESFWI